MGYRKHKVKQGDCISSIAYKYGFFPNTIWNDSKNSELKELRKDPNVLQPGDEVYVRDKEEKEEACASEQKHRFRRKGVPEELSIQFWAAEEPKANEPYALEVEGVFSEGQTGGDGVVAAWIPPDAKKGSIVFHEAGDEYELILGGLDPVSEISGVQARLKNLDFYEGPVNGTMNDQLEQAIRDFQQASDLASTGELDNDTREGIVKAHGG
ncbi:MAG: peptidoglycan-binding protein [Planctomycetota bacterium]|jgi:hypothetical protein